MNKESNPTSHQEKKERLTTSLDSKIDFVKSLHSFILSLDDERNTIDAGDLQINLWDMLEAHIGEVEGLIDGFDKVKRERELKIQKNTEEVSFRLAWPKEKRERSAEHRKLLEDYEAEIDEIEKDSEVLYIKQLIEYATYLKNLRKDRDEYKKIYDDEGGVFKKDGLLAKKINNFLLERYKTKPKGPKQGNLGNANYVNYIKDVKFKGLGTVVVFKRNARDRLRDFNDLGGRSYGRSSIYFCFDDDIDGQVDQHEYNHTLFGAHVDHTIVYRQGFIGEIHKILNNDDLYDLLNTASENMSKEGVDKRQMVGKYISTYYRKLMGEIFADLSNIFNNQLADGFYGHFDNSVEDLKRYYNVHIKDDDTKSIIKDSYRKLMNNLNRYMGELAKLVYCSNVLDVKEETMAAFLVLSGDTRKVLRYLVEKFGDDKIREVFEGFDPEKDKIYKGYFDKELSKILNGADGDSAEGE